MPWSWEAFLVLSLLQSVFLPHLHSIRYVHTQDVCCRVWLLAQAVSVLQWAQPLSLGPSVLWVFLKDSWMRTPQALEHLPLLTSNLL